MPPLQSLLDRAGDLKRELVEYSRDPRYRREINAEIREAFPAGAADEDHLISLMDRLILQHVFSDGLTILESFVRRHQDLSEPDRNIVLAWRDVREGVFRIDDIVEGGLSLFNLVDELSYQTYSNTGPSFAESLERGMYLFARLVPLENDWLFSGGVIPIPAEKEDAAYDVALRMAQTMPRVVFQNPAKLEQARALQREERQDFIAYFGSDLVVLPGKDVAGRMDAYLRWRMTEKRDEDGTTAFERAKASGDRPPKLSDLAFSNQFAEADSVGIIYDDIDGLNLFADFRLVEETFAEPSLVEDPKHAEATLGYLENPDIIPLPLRRLIDRYPANADQVFQELLGVATFTWPREGELLLRELKPDYFARPPLPSVTPIGGDLLQHRRLTASVRSVGRNEPCPCGSGRKYKHCHGRNKR